MKKTKMAMISLAKRFRISKRFSPSYDLPVLVILVSTIWLSIALFLKLAGNDWELWNLLGLPEVPGPLDRLSELSWMSSQSESRFSRYYVKHLYFQWPLLVLLIALRRFVIEAFAKSDVWLREKDQFTRHRRSLFAIVLIVIFLQFSMTPTGLNWPGFWGWTFAPVELSSEPTLKKGTSDLPSFFSQSMLLQNGKYAKSEGFAKGNAFFLHFDNGEVLPWNHEITGMVFPMFYFGSVNPRNREQLIKCISHTLEKRRAGNRYLIPLKASYPPHTPYMTIDYSEYPSASHIKAMSFWEVEVFVKPGVVGEISSVREVSFVSVENENS